MSVIIIGNGPMTNEPAFAVTAPGSRTWQIVRTVAGGLVQSSNLTEEIIVFGLDDQPRDTQPVISHITSAGQKIAVQYHPLSYEKFRSLGTDKPDVIDIPANIRAVVGTGSAQPYSTAARFAKIRSLPLWIDIFGDPLCETQTRLELSAAAGENSADSDTHLIHVWKLFLDALLQGDRFSSLSRRQRHALQGQLGCAGRLNQHTASHSLCHYLPYAVFEDDTMPDPSAKSTPDDHFTLMWCGSFNTWMDVPTLTLGISGALKSNPNMRLLVVGGKIAGYNETSYGQFLQGIREAGVEGSVTLMDWQPLAAMRNLYTQCDLGISIDRFTYEAELGSRTRLINFLAAGLPVTSTVVTELSAELAEAGMLAPFEMGDANGLTQILIEISRGNSVAQKKGNQCRDYILQCFNGAKWGHELRQWVARPEKAPDHNLTFDHEQTNALLDHWTKVREPLGI